MRDYVIMTDSNCDLPEHIIMNHGIEVIPMQFKVGDRKYSAHYDWRELSDTEFYDRLRSGDMVTTEPLSYDDILRVFKEVVESGKDILYISFSSALSSSFSAVTDAAQTVRMEHHDARVLVVDSLCASLGQGLLVYLTALQKANGADINVARAYCESTKSSITHWFTVDDLGFLRRGGRLGAVSAAFGSMLSVKPVLKMDSSGRLELAYRSRGRNAALQNLVNQMEISMADEAPMVFIGHADCAADADMVSEEIVTRFPQAKTMVSTIGPNIGAHSGPGTLAMFFVGGTR